jgi:hypothetical protein
MASGPGRGGMVNNGSNMTTDIDIREVLPNEHELLGQLMVEVYSNLDGFPSKNE